MGTVRLNLKDITHGAPPPISIARQILDVIGLRLLDKAKVYFDPKYPLIGKVKSADATGAEWEIQWKPQKMRNAADNRVVDCLGFCVFSDAIDLNCGWFMPMVNVLNPFEQKNFADGFGKRLLHATEEKRSIAEKVKNGADPLTVDNIGSWENDDDIKPVHLERMIDRLGKSHLEN